MFSSIAAAGGLTLLTSVTWGLPFGPLLEVVLPFGRKVSVSCMTPAGLNLGVGVGYSLPLLESHSPLGTCQHCVRCGNQEFITVPVMNTM